MRNVTDTMNRYLHSKQSSEPVIVIGVFLAGREVLFADKNIPGVRPNILSVSGLSDYTKTVGSGSAKSLTVTFDDASEEFKHHLDNTNFYLCKCNVYQCFSKVSVNDKFLIFSGNLSAPIEYDTTQKTLTVQIMTDVKKEPVGFTTDEGYFGDLTGNQSGQFWPMMFGSVCREKTIALRCPLYGVLETKATIPDPSLYRRLEQAKNLLCPKTLVAESVVTKKVEALPEVPDESVYISPSWGALTSNTDSVAMYSPNPTCVEKRYKEICSIMTDIAEQEENLTDTLTVYNGIKFTQRSVLSFRIRDAIFNGWFSGNTFHITNRIHPKTELLTSDPIYSFAGEALVYKGVQGLDAGNSALPVSSTVCSCNLSATLPGDYNCEDKTSDISATYGFGGGSEDSWRYFYSMNRGSEFVADPGEFVLSTTKSDLIYIVSIVPGTVDAVLAYKHYNAANTDKLVEVPESYYEIQETDYGAFTAVEIKMPRKLSEISQIWKDDIFVSFTSDIGPHAIDVIEWLVENFSSYEIDEDSFSFVRPYLDNYPVNFALQSQKDLWTLLSDIAYQVRCEIMLKGNKLYITYLPLKPNPVVTIDSSKVKTDSLIIGLIDTNDLITDYTVNWAYEDASFDLASNYVTGTDRPTYNPASGTQLNFTLKHNLSTYGPYPESFDYYVLNDFQSCLKTSTFWLIRKANVYKTLKFKGPIEFLLLEHGDSVLVNLKDFSEDEIICIVENTVFDYENNEVEVELRTPVKEGESSEYYWYWPSNKPAKARFPLEGEDAGSTIDISVPETHIFYDSGSSFILSHGDPYPSDIGDAYPEITCYYAGSTYATPINYASIVASFATESFVNSMKPNIPNLYAYKQLIQNKPNSPGVGVPIDNLPCTFDVRVNYIVPSQVAKPGQACKTTGTGMPCEGTEYSFCHKFMNLKGAEYFITKRKQEIDNLKLDGGRYEIGVFQPVAIDASPTILNNRDGVDCSDPDSTEAYYFYEATKALLI